MIEILDLIPLSKVLSEIVEALKEELKNFGFGVRVYNQTSLPKASFNVFRKQYNSESILNFLSQFQGKILGVTNEDLYNDKLSFVFGDFDLNGNVIVSYYRLRPEYYQQSPSLEKTIERLVKVCLYFLGRSMGLEKCKNRFCIMYEAESVPEIDHKGTSLCNECKIKASVKGIKGW